MSIFEGGDSTSIVNCVQYSDSCVHGVTPSSPTICMEGHKDLKPPTISCCADKSACVNRLSPIDSLRGSMSMGVVLCYVAYLYCIFRSPCLWILLITLPACWHTSIHADSNFPKCTFPAISARRDAPYRWS